MSEVREKTEMHTDFWRRNLETETTCKTLAWEHNIKKTVKEVCWGNVDWINMA